MFLGNVIRGFHGGAVLLGNLIEVALGCGWWRCAREKCAQRVAWWSQNKFGLCAREVHAPSCKSHCKCGVKVALVEVLRTRGFYRKVLGSRDF